MIRLYPGNPLSLKSKKNYNWSGRTLPNLNIVLYAVRELLDWTVDTSTDFEIKSWIILANADAFLWK